MKRFASIVITILLITSCVWAQEKNEELQPVRIAPAGITSVTSVQKDSNLQVENIAAGAVKRKLEVSSKTQAQPQPALPNPDVLTLPLTVINEQQIQQIRQKAIKPRPVSAQQAIQMGWQVNEIPQNQRPRPVNDLIKTAPNEAQEIRRKAKELE